MRVGDSDGKQRPECGGGASVRPTAREPQNLACSQAQNEGIQKPRHACMCAGLIIGARISIPTSANNGGATKDCLIPPPYKEKSKGARAPHPHPPLTPLAAQLCLKMYGEEE